MVTSRYIPKLKVPVHIDMRDGVSMKGQLFLSADTRILDLLNVGQPYLPFLREDGYIILLNKLDITRVLPLDQKI